MRADLKAPGFTLIEILIVVAIMAGLAAITLPTMHGARQRTAVARARAELAIVAQALENYRGLYGDYPQTGDFTQATPDPTQPLAPAYAQTKVFNALTGVFGPRAFGPDDRLDGYGFIDVAKLTVERAPDGAQVATVERAGRRAERCTSFLDPWGRRYLYYYKSASNPAAWRAAGYILYSAGPDGRHVPPEFVSGLGAQEVAVAAANADNVYAGEPMR